MISFGQYIYTEVKLVGSSHGSAPLGQIWLCQGLGWGENRNIHFYPLSAGLSALM